MSKNIAGYVFALVVTVFTFLSGNVQAADITPPTASLVIAINVPLNGPVAIQFDEYIAGGLSLTTTTPPALPNGTIRVFNTDTNVTIPGSIQFYPSTNQAIFIPSAPFASTPPPTSYSVETSGVTGIFDLAGNFMVPAVLGSFTTAAASDVINPTANLLTLINVNWNGPVTIQFDETMQVSTLTNGLGGAIQIGKTSDGTLVNFNISYDASTNLLYLTPTVSFSIGETYTLSIGAGPVDLSGNSLNVFPSINFTTVNVPVDTTPPTVDLLTTTDVHLNGPVVIQFSEYIASGFPLPPLDISPVPTDTIKITNLSTGDVITGNIQFSTSTNQATFIPFAPFSGSTNYAVHVSSAAQDLSGNALLPYTNSFVTMTNPDIIQPSATLETLVDVPLNGPVVIQFDESMKGSSITYTSNGAVMIIDPSGNFVAGEITYDATTNKANIFSVPFAPFASDTLYTVYITTGPLDLAGNQLAAFTPATFRTVKGDIVKPTATIITPTNVALTGPVVVQFTEIIVGLTNCPVTADTTPGGTTFVLDTNGNFVNGNICFDPLISRASFTPDVPFSASLNDYKFYITSGLKDVAGNTFDPTGWPADFTVVASYSVTATAGANGTISPASATVLSGGSQAFTITPVTGFDLIGIIDNGVTILNNDPLALPPGLTKVGSVYTYTVNPVLANHTITVSFGADVTAPTITTVVPNNGATSVTPGQLVKITFSEPMNPATIIGSNVYVKASVSGNLVAGSVGYDAASNMATFTVTGSFALNTLYDIYVTTGVKDASGNSLGSNQKNSFTTATTIWSVTSTSDGNGTIVPVTGTTVAVHLIPYAVTITPNVGYIPATLTVNGANFFAALVDNLDGTYTYTILGPAMTANKTIAVTFAPQSYTLSATAGANGSITPASSIVLSGGSQAFTITPVTGYDLVGIIDNGVTILNNDPSSLPAGLARVGATYTYTVSTILENHTISASFRLDVTAPIIVDRTPIPGAVDVAPSAVITARFNEAMDATTLNTSTFTVKDNNSNAVLGNVTYSPNNFTATFTPDTPLQDGSIAYTVTLFTGIKDLAGNALSTVGGLNTWTFTTTATARTINVIVSAGGTVTSSPASASGVTIPPGINSVIKASNNGTVSFTITPEVGFALSQILVDNTPLTTLPLKDPITLQHTYVLSGITVDHTVTIGFEVITSGGGGGSTVNLVDLDVRVVDPNGSATLYAKYGDTSNQLSKITLTGLTSANSDYSRLYWSLTNTVTTRSLTLYKDASKTLAVAQGSVVNNGTINLVAQSASGLGGTVDVAYTADDIDGLNNIYVAKTTQTTFWTVPVEQNGYSEIVFNAATGYQLGSLTDNINLSSGVNDVLASVVSSRYTVKDTMTHLVTAGFINDITAPTATHLSPTGNNVGFNDPVVIEFSEAMLPSSITTGVGGTIMVRERISAGPPVVEGNVVAGNISFDPITNKATFTPTAPYVAGKTYRVTISSGPKDLAGNSLATFTPVNFTVTSAMRTVTASVAGSGSITPAAVQNIPTGGSVTYTLVPGNINFVLKSISLNNMPILPASMPTANPDGSYTYTTPAISTNTNIIFTFSNGTYTLTATAVPLSGGSINPASATAANGGSQSYSVVPATGYTLVSVVATNKTSGAATTLSAPYTLSSITSDYDIIATFIADIVKPTATLLTTTNVGFTDPIEIQFSEGIQPATITTGVSGSILVKDDLGNLVAGSISFNPVTNRASFISTAPFVATKTYTIYITTEPKDLAGNSLAAFPLAGQPNSFTITTNMWNVAASTVGGGAVTPTSKSVANNGTITYTITPDADTIFSAITVNGTPVIAPVFTYNGDGSISWTSPNITGSTNIIVTYVAASAALTLNASAGQGGSITPSGSIGVAFDSEVVFTIAPSIGYSLATLLLDGVVTTNGLVNNGSSPSTYTLSGITETHTIAVSFTNDVAKPIATFVSPTSNVGFSEPVVIQFNEAMQPTTITTGVGGTILVNDSLGNLVAGTISYDPTTNKASFTPTAPFKANSTYRVTITTDPKDLSGNSLAVFTPVNFTTTTQMWTVSSSAVGTGIVSPSGNKAVANNATVTYILTPGNADFVLSTITVDGTPVASPVLSYNATGAVTWTTGPITTNTNIVFTFVSANITLTATAGQWGTISPSGSFGAAYDSSRAFTITPAAGYSILKITDTVGGKITDITSSVPAAGGVYTLNNIRADHTILVTFINDTVRPIATYVSATNNIGFSEPVEIQFNEEMQPATITTGVGGTVMVKDSSGNVVAGSINYDATNNKASFKPNAPYTAGASYRVIITTDPLDLAGNRLTAFTPVNFAVTTQMWKVTASAIGSGAITPVTKDVANNTSVTYTVTPNNNSFTLGSITINGALVSSPVLTYNPEGSISWTSPAITGNATIVFTFVSNIVKLTVTSGANGSLTIFEKAGDVGNQLRKLVLSGVHALNSDAGKLYWKLEKAGANYTVSLFKDSSGTLPNLVAKGSIITANGLVTLLAQGGSGINGSVILAYTADDAANLAANIMTVDSVPVGTTVAIDLQGAASREITVSPAAGYELLAFTDNGLSVTGLVTLNELVYKISNMRSDRAIDVSFETDINPPRVTATSPTNLEKDISPTPVIKVTFSEEMDAASITSAGIMLKDEYGNSLSGAIAYSGELEATFTPKLALNKGVKYTVIVSASVKDHNKISMTAAYQWSFTVRAATHAVTLTTGSNGTVTSVPFTLTQVPDDSDVSFTITPYGSGASAHPWYTLDRILLDSVVVANPPQNSDGTYTYILTNLVKDQSVGVTFKKTPRIVTVTPYSNGTVTAVPALTSGSVTVNDNDVVTLTFTPSSGYTLASLTDNGVSLSLTIPYSAGLVRNTNNSWTYTTTVISNRTFSPAFTNTLTVQATAGSGGTITPVSTNVSYGGSQTFTVTQTDGYKVNQFKVNGVVKSLNAGNQYTETNVTSNLTASVTFTPYLYKITVRQPENGTISPSGAVYLDTGTSSFVITPNTGYKLTSVTDSNGDVAITGNNGEAYTYTTNPVSSSFTFSAAIALKSYTITMSAGANGAVSANGVTANASTTRDVSVNQGGAITFTAIPGPTYALSDIKIDGVSVKNLVINNTYTLTADRVTKNYSVAVSFEKLFVVTSSAGPNGTINPLGTINLTETANTMEYTFTPSAGYSIEKVIYAGNDVTSGIVGNHYLLTASNPAQSINVTFKLSPVNATCGTANGTTVTTIPTSNLCSVGSPSIVSSSLPWSWTCAGSNGGTNASCSANIQTYAVSFVSGGNGTLTGSASQTVNHGSSTTEVTAVSAAGYQFLNWTGTGGFITTAANPLAVYYVASSQEITANFVKIPLKSGVVIPAPNKTEPGIEDALKILNIAAGKISWTQQDLDQGDVAPLVDGKPYGNNIIDTYDAIGILRMVVGLL